MRSSITKVVLVLAGVIVVALASMAVAGVFSGSSTANPKSVTKATAKEAPEKYYVSLGDSYSVGYQPEPTGGPTAGYTGIVAADTHMKLVNFGCGGATTESILDTVGCKVPYGPTALTGRATYTTKTQAAAAEAFISSHRGEIGLITVTIGGNDVTSCAGAQNATTCVLAVVPKIKKNVKTLASGLLKAAGTGVPLIGITYPDVILGDWVYPSGHTDTSLASLSATAFKSLINPALKEAYDSAGGHFVDITKDTDGYLPLTQTTALAPFGSVPVAVARVCQLTWYCTLGNIHAKTAGYDLIGREVVAEYRSLVK